MEQVRKIAPHIRKAEGVVKHNFDLNDCDNILRIEAEGISSNTIIELVQHHGYYCEELS